MYDLIIIGGGPAGVAAGVYAARKRLKTLFITPEWGGQSIVSEGIQNWIGTINISGAELAESLREHLEHYKADIVEILDGEKVTRVDKESAESSLFTVTLESGKTHTTRAVLVATGSSRKKLDIPGAAEFEHKGITYCASCDGPMFADRDVVVIGGGNAGFETAAQLLAYSKHVTLIQRASSFRADEVTVAKVLEHPNMRGVTNTELLRIENDGKFVSGITYRDIGNQKELTIPCQGIFVEIGSEPATDFVKDIVTLNKTGHVVIDPRTQKTSTPGIWAAGDCTDILYHQNNIAAGDAVRALEDIYATLKTK